MGNINRVLVLTELTWQCGGQMTTRSGVSTLCGVVRMKRKSLLWRGKGDSDLDRAGRGGLSEKVVTL